MTVHEGNATDDCISLPILATGNSVTFARMKKAIYVDSFIAVQHFPAAGGFITLANEITYAHCLLLNLLRMTRHVFIAASRCCYLIDGKKSSASGTP
ncbi:hypothetical protein [Pseudomonas fluorescens]|uniref:hypothetical protein n=1 Tax=Pseudomonas fluorescens TaxID=294 RepID=UPI001FD5D0E9|nr:hypothetical protein [Pseudomonas fluorescens]